MSEENHDALESDSAIESPMKIPKKKKTSFSAFSRFIFEFLTALLLQRKWYLSAKIRSFLSIGQVNFL